jgi:SPP1 gp7 family putative phage head morphogenesis protein
MNKRQEASLARRVARERFLKARIVEREFGHNLVGVGREVGRIITGFVKAGHITDFRALSASLSAYSLAIAPWAAAVVSRMQAQVSRRDLAAWRQLSQSIGSTLHREIERAPTGILLRDLQAEAIALITSLPAEAATRVHKLTQELMVEGRRASEIEQEIMDSGNVTQARARLIARTEVSRTASLLTQSRATSVGSEGYIWRTVGDSDVRPALTLSASQRARFVGSHRKLEGKFIRWDNPPVSGQRGERAHAGQIYNCRCWPEPVIRDF